MYTNKFRQPSGEYIGEDKCNYESALDLLCTDTFKFCGCGHPESALQYMRDVMSHINRLKEEVWENKITYEQWNQGGKKIFSNDGAEYFAYYILDNLELTEHGGLVPGWLSEKGLEVLEELKTIFV